jgi:IclR family acetate operon transcriptional repressor
MQLFVHRTVVSGIHARAASIPLQNRITDTGGGSFPGQNHDFGCAGTSGILIGRDRMAIESSRQTGDAPASIRQLLHQNVSEARGEAQPKPRKTIQSVTRALDILETLSRAENDMKLNDIAKQCGINISTCHHLLSTLSARGYVAQKRGSRNYHLSDKIVDLTRAQLDRVSLVDVARPAMLELNLETQETIYLGAMRNSEMVRLEMLDSSYAVKVDNSGIFKSNAAHATAAGKAILAWLPETEVARVIAEKGMPEFTEHTITTLSALMEDLEKVRKLGFATDKEEFLEDVYCVAAPVKNYTGDVIAAVTCSAPATRATGRHWQDMIDGVIRCARSVSNRLGDKGSMRPEMIQPLT